MTCPTCNSTGEVCSMFCDSNDPTVDAHPHHVTCPSCDGSGLDPTRLSRRIYLASSWRNPDQPRLVQVLRAAGHEVYDFRNPTEGDNGFHWSDIDEQWQDWDAATYRFELTHPVAESGFGKDFAAMEWADTFVLRMPCGRSAHLELGWAIGAGKPSVIYLEDGEPELMYKMADALVVDDAELLAYLDHTDPSPP